MNLLQGKIQCIQCKNRKLVKDFQRQEVYCSKCGLILVDTTIPTLKQMENMATEKPKNEKQIKRDYYRLKRYFYNFM